MSDHQKGVILMLSTYIAGALTFYIFKGFS